MSSLLAVVLCQGNGVVSMYYFKLYIHCTCTLYSLLNGRFIIHWQMAFMMCCAFMLTWTPYAVVSFWAAYGEPKSIPVRLTLASVLIAKTSTIWNPLIYFVLNKKFKPHIRLCLRTFFRCETNAQQRRARSPWHFCNSGSSMTSSL